MVERYIRWVLGHRVAVLVFCGIVSALSLTVVKDGVFASSLVKLFLGDSPDYRRFQQLSEEFGSGDLIFVAIQDSVTFTPDGWERLERAAERIVEMDAFAEASTIADADFIESIDEMLVVEPYRGAVQNQTKSLSELRTTAQDDQFLRGSLVSDDLQSVMMVLEVDSTQDLPVEVFPKILDRVFEVFKQEGFERSQLHLAGFKPDTVEATFQARFSIETIFPITSLVLSAVVFFLFGQFWPVIATSGVGIVAILWTLAFTIFFDPEINLMLAMIPAVMMVVSFSDVVHLCSSYLLELQNGLSKERAILKSSSEVGLACWYTSVTTFFGFVALAFVPTPVFQRLGITLGFGVAIALLLAMTLVPIFFSYMPKPEVRRSHSQNTIGGRLIDGVSDGCARLATGYPLFTTIIFSMLSIGAFIGISRIHIETNMQERLREDNHIRVAQDFIASNFTGTNLLDFYITGPEGKVVNQETLRKLKAFQTSVAEREGVGAAYSLVDLIELLHAELAPESNEVLPTGTNTIAQYLLLFEMSGGEGLYRLLDDSQSTLHLTVRLSNNDLVRTNRLGTSIVDELEATLGPDYSVEVTGLTYLFGGWIDFIMEGQKRGFLFAFLSTTLMMFVCLRSWRATIVSMIPNALPLLAMGGVLGFLWDKVDSDTMMVAMIAIGIAVDDTIHFLTRFRMECERQMTLDDAITQTFAHTGRGIVKTTIILCLGMAPFNLSDYLSTRMMGTLLPLTLFMALIADLLLIPALAKLGLFRISRTRVFS